MSVGSVNRYSALELDDEGNIVQPSKTSKPATNEETSAPTTSNHSINTRSQVGTGLTHQQKKQQQHQQSDDAAAPAPANQGEQKPRNRVSDRNRRGRGGAGGPGAPHRGGYIGDGEKREFDRRGAPGDDRPRGRPRKGPNSLGRYGDDDNHRRNRPNKNAADASGEEAAAAPADAAVATDATATLNAEAAAPADAAAAVNGVATPAAEAAATATESADAAALEAAAAAAAVQEEEDKTLTFEEYQAQLKAKAVEADHARQLRVVEINDKQWKKVNAAPDAKKKKSVLTVSGQEILVEEAVKPQAERVEKKKKMLSLDEFVGTVAPAASESAGPAGSSEYRGRGGRGRGAGRGRGGRGGRGVAVPIADKDAFPDLSAAAKKN